MDRLSSAQLCELTGLPYRVLHYWCRTGLADCDGPVHSGISRTFSVAEAARIEALAAVRAVAGAGPLRRIRPVLCEIDPTAGGYLLVGESGGVAYLPGSASPADLLDAIGALGQCWLIDLGTVVTVGRLALAA